MTYNIWTADELGLLKERYLNTIPKEIMKL